MISESSEISVFHGGSITRTVDDPRGVALSEN